MCKKDDWRWPKIVQNKLILLTKEERAKPQIGYNVEARNVNDFLGRKRKVFNIFILVYFY